MAETETQPPSSREIAGEDFLFHLYRGSELLQDNRVHEAKQELEQALGLQPRDPKGQDLLAIVYFRLGLYPRAIQIYETLITAHPEATTPRINLALCYLKTGQPAAARTELERVIQRDPSHARAWGYLGLAFQRIGDFERALHAFQSGGHHGMARRLLETSGAAPPRSLSSPERAAVSHAMSDAVDELDKRDFRTETGTIDRLTPSGTWAAVEPGRETPPERRSFWPALSGSIYPSESLAPASAAGDPSPSVRAPAIAWPKPTAAPVIEGVAASPSRPAIPPPTVPPAHWSAPIAVDRFARDSLFVFPRDHAAALHATGVVLIRPASTVAVRLDAIRAVASSGALSTRVVGRRSRGATTDEPLGGPINPLYEVEGASELVLGAPPGTKLAALALGDEPLCVREGLLVAMEGDVAFEGGRIPGIEGDPVPVVSLRGAGTVTLALPLAHGAVEVVDPREVIVRAPAVLGWTGRVSLRALPPSESFARVRGLVALRGEGMVLLDGR